MPAKRVVPKARRAPLTPEAVAAFQAGDWLGLHHALNLKPWEASPLDVDPTDKDLRGGSMWHRSVDQALNLRKQLEEAWETANQQDCLMSVMGGSRTLVSRGGQRRYSDCRAV